MRLPVNAVQTNFLRVTGLIVLLTCVVLLTSCSMFRHKEKLPVYYSAVEADPLEIPPGLDRPTSTSALVIVTPMAPLPQAEMKIVPPRINSQSAGGKDTSYIHWSSEGVYLLVEDKKESVFRRLGVAIQRAGMTLSDTGIDDSYRFEYRHDPKDPDRGFFSKLAFWRDDGPNYSGDYLAEIQTDGESTRVIIKNADGSQADQAAAEHLLNIFGERLG